VHVPALFDQIEAALEAADRALAAAAPPPPVRVPVPWSDDRELMDLVQDLLAAGVEGDGELALRHIARLRADLLLRHRIEAVDVDGAREGLFSFPQDTGPRDTAQPSAEPVTVRPALLGDGGRVLRRGEVRYRAAADRDGDDRDGDDRDRDDQAGNDR